VLAYRHARSRVLLVTLLLTVIIGPTASGQGGKTSAKVFTLEEAINFAVQNYPAVRVAAARGAAARAGVDLARTSYLPRLDSVWQSNRATRNNIFGLLFPQPVVSSISGPALPSTSGDSVWGSAAGLLFSWEPYDFGFRRATVAEARATQARAAAQGALTRLDVAVAAADAFLTLLAAQQTVRAAQADVERREVLAESVRVLVKNELRPGADASRAEAELARARIGLARAQQQEDVSRAVLANVLGIAGTEVKINPGPLLASPPTSTPPAPALSAHPEAAVQHARIEEARAREHVLGKSYYPRLNFESTVFGRGSGANTNGTFASGLNGLGLERANWAAGMTVTFPVFDIFSLRAREKIEAANERAEDARYDQTLQDLTGLLQQAQAALAGARRVAENTPIELRAARDTETQARARYQAGLATLVEVAEAQSLLVQADIDDALTRLAVWHNLATLTAAEGNLDPFIQLLRTTPGGP
jgi:outer membrane protein